MSWLRRLLKRFEPLDCYCRCHNGGKEVISPGSYVVLACQHCVGDAPAQSVTDWGTSAK